MADHRTLASQPDLSSEAQSPTISASPPARPGYLQRLRLPGAQAVRNKVSQYTLRSMHGGIPGVTSPSASSSSESLHHGYTPNPASEALSNSANASTRSLAGSSLPNYARPGSTSPAAGTRPQLPTPNLNSNSSSEHTRLFGLKNWRLPRYGSADSGGLIRLEDSDDEASDPKTLKAAGRWRSWLARPKGWTRSSRRWLAKRPLVRAGLQMAGIFILSTLIMGGTLWLALPTLERCVLSSHRLTILRVDNPNIHWNFVDREDRPKLKIPKSFDQLKDLNTLLKKYKTIYPFRTVLCFVIVYLLCVFLCLTPFERYIHLETVLAHEF